ncbi:hypothetical protein EVG20_g7889 [Dentipellis fragilis]|uniref:Pentacotripeptide-repeat region of PRORP domain-containing protein n=1 Tax=Dentipellis fragilis TaxID=205917 RepID=A0A4Y9YAT2_9AGAM|nr:hypothetical protein EVG20_g7889 [Dentipellis fragilis]
METANSLLAQMDRLGKSGESTVAVNVFAMTIIMSGYLRIGDKVKAKQVYDNMVARGIKPTSVTYSAILKAYCRDESEESVRIARDFLQVLVDTKPEERTWVPRDAPYSVALEQLHGPLISEFVRAGDPEEVEKLIQEMFNLGGEPSLATWSLLLKVYRRVGDIASVRAVWPNILDIAYHRPLAEARQQLPENSPREDLLRRGNGTLCGPLSMYMDALSVAGYHNEVAEIWQKLNEEGFAFDVHNWNQLVVALVRAGEPERAFSIVERIIIPSQRIEQEVPEERDASADSPLVFQEPPTAQEFDKNEVKQSVYRLAAAKLRRQSFGRRLQERDPRFRPSETRPDDPAQSLYTLSQISPLWMAWRAHRPTLRVLMAALGAAADGPAGAARAPAGRGGRARRRLGGAAAQGGARGGVVRADMRGIPGDGRARGGVRAQRDGAGGEACEAGHHRNIAYTIITWIQPPANQRTSETRDSETRPARVRIRMSTSSASSSM